MISNLWRSMVYIEWMVPSFLAINLDLRRLAYFCLKVLDFLLINLELEYKIERSNNESLSMDKTGISIYTWALMYLCFWISKIKPL